MLIGNDSAVKVCSFASGPDATEFHSLVWHLDNRLLSYCLSCWDWARMDKTNKKQAHNLAVGPRSADSHSWASVSSTSVDNDISKALFAHGIPWFSRLVPRCVVVCLFWNCYLLVMLWGQLFMWFWLYYRTASRPGFILYAAHYYESSITWLADQGREMWNASDWK